MRVCVCVFTQWYIVIDLIVRDFFFQEPSVLNLVLNFLPLPRFLIRLLLFLPSPLQPEVDFFGRAVAPKPQKSQSPTDTTGTAGRQHVQMSLQKVVGQPGDLLVTDVTQLLHCAAVTKSR